MDEAERCHRLLLMREGEILADGTPDALRIRTGSETVGVAFLRPAAEAMRADRTEEPHDESVGASRRRRTA
ncbi:hypothetical protein GCM10010129_35480 [Streptomyces fumigatiscleroticus]|nr:hypothetical protein GCM10010129_35480 [Streptomyces fumigatiscleroticus]